MITAIQDDVITIETELGEIKVALQGSGTGSGLLQLPMTELLILFFFVVGAAVIAFLLWSHNNLTQKIFDMINLRPCTLAHYTKAFMTLTGTIYT